MQYEVLISILSTLAALLSALATIGMFIISRKQTTFLKKTEKERNTPFLYPIKHEFRKDKWIRYYEFLDIGGFIPKKHYKNLSDSEKDFFDHAKNFNNEVYFDYLDNQLFLVTKSESDTNGYLIEHNSVEIELINYGALITKIHIDKIHQYFKKTVLHYNGGDESYYTNVILPNQKIKIVLDEVKDAQNINSCQIGIEEYNNLQNYNMFEDIVPLIVSYNKYIIELSVWNQYNEKFRFKISIYRNGEKFYRNVVRIK